MTPLQFAALLDAEDSAFFWHQYVANLEAGQRKGQAVFNAASHTFSAETDVLRSSLVDCFYQNDLVPAFLERLADILTDPRRLPRY